MNSATPPTFESLNLAANAHLKSGRIAEAETIFLEIARRFPREPRSRFMLGALAQRQNRLPEAMDWLQKAIAIEPQVADPYFIVGLIHQQENQLGEAIAAYRKFLALKPNDGKGLNNLGRALLDSGDIPGAIEILQQAIRSAPTNAGAFSNLGEAQRMTGDLTGAVRWYEKALAVDPNCAEAHGNLGVVQAQRGQMAAGIASTRRSIALDPKAHRRRFNLARMYQDCGMYDEAIAECQTAIGLAPQAAKEFNLLGNLYGMIGQVPQCIAAQKRAVELQPNFASAHSNLLLSQLYLPDITPRQLFEAHLQWASQQTGSIQPIGKPFANDRSANRRLRIGYQSPNFSTHSVAYFFESVLAAHDRSAVEIFCYGDVAKPDQTTERLKALCENWRDVKGKSDTELATIIRRDKIDILIDLAGHTANNRLPMYALRPAPVQMTWIGYPATTGMKAIDYRLTDPIADPVGQSDSLHTEKLLRIPGGCWAYCPPESPPVAPFPALANGYVTFGSFNNLPKVTPQVIQTWAGILSQVPGSRMLIKAAGLKSKLARDHLHDQFARSGISHDRIELISWTTATLAHLQLYDRIDIALDTFPYNGTTTTCEALWMGVPVITLAGTTHVSRVGSALLTHTGCRQWIATDLPGYSQLAIQLAADLQNNPNLRFELRGRLEHSTVCDAGRLARELEAIYRQAWSRFTP
jgi:predicted O-linked N-acetylglucosamine transferase (SPINDLY family)